MKAYGEVNTYLHALLMSPLDGYEWPVSCTDCFTSNERAPLPAWAFTQDENLLSLRGS